MNERTNCEALFTQEVLNTVRPSAEKWAKRTHGALTADDLLQTAVLALWKTRETSPVLDAVRSLTARVRREYLTWVNGTNSRFGAFPNAHEVSPRQRYMSAVELPMDEGSGALSMGNPVEGWETLLDIERAIHTLNAEEQQWVRWWYWDELTVREIAKRAGVGKSTVQRRVDEVFPVIVRKLRVQLAAYE